MTLLVTLGFDVFRRVREAGNPFSSHVWDAFGVMAAWWSTFINPLQGRCSGVEARVVLRAGSREPGTQAWLAGTDSLAGVVTVGYRTSPGGRDTSSSMCADLGASEGGGLQCVGVLSADRRGWHGSGSQATWQIGRSAKPGTKAGLAGTDSLAGVMTGGNQAAPGARVATSLVVEPVC